MNNCTAVVSLADQALEIDRLSLSAQKAFDSVQSFSKEFEVAQHMLQLRARLTPEIMECIMGLMNSDIGFRTDRDPKIPDKDGKFPEPYGIEVVKDCFIASRLRGFHCIGNEWNILAGRFYGCQSGFERKVRTYEGVTDFEDSYDIPRILSERTAGVKCRAKWKQNGQQRSVERDYPVNLNAGMKADALIGKAKKHLYADAYKLISGKQTPEGEIGDDAINVDATVTTVDPADVFKGKAAQATPASTPTQTAPSPAAAEPGKAAAPSNIVELNPEVSPPQLALQNIVIKEGYTFEQFQKWAKASGSMTKEDCEKLTGFSDLSEAQAKRYVKAKDGLLRQLAAAKGAAK